jgi:murein DD-endopeptidase MepM/ murein hydrolase activator NlpD
MKQVLAEIIPEIIFALKLPFKLDSYIYLASEFRGFLRFLNIYGKDKVLVFTENFEGAKAALVKSILIKRGRRNRMFLHLSAMTILTIGVVVSPFIQDTTLFGRETALSFAQSENEPLITTPDVFDTKLSEKPRDRIITYTVQNGDTISGVARKFGIDENTIRWRNNLRTDNITVGDTLEILPVSGVAHRVARGDTVYTIAKRYNTNAQGIVDFPFNDFANPQTFSLVEGQILIVPDGMPPREAPRIVRRQFFAAGPVEVGASGFTWPVRGPINQGYAWYHRGIDIGGSVGTPIVAAHSGRVSEVYTSGWHGGYGIHVIIVGNNGYVTLYAHMSGVNVSPGDVIEAGRSVIGWIGMTGRTTGPHLHFEIRGPGGFLNPLGIL